MGKPSVHPMGTIIYKPEKCFNGYTLFQANEHGATLVDMNGGVVNHWRGLQGFPNKLLPGGQVFGSRAERNGTYGWQDQKDLVQVDWDGNVTWQFKQNEYVEDPGYDGEWMARQHHDYQREGNILWDWCVHEHFDELGFDEAAKNVLARNPNIVGNGQGDWMHINCMSVLGPNKWYDAGDERFHPDNIIWDGRATNIIAIIDKKTGKLVWKLGPDYTTGKAKEIGQIIGQHHAHMIPRGLPGEGNILIFDNGGWAGYGAPNPSAPTGNNNAHRDYSRVIEIDPVKMEIVWQCRPMDIGCPQPFVADHFYSCYISSAQRLPNGNTLITEGSDGRLLEVTADHEIVWEYISPYFGEKGIKTNMVYRAYRYPYDYVPQVEPPKEVAIAPIDNVDYRLPGARSKEFRRMVNVEGTEGYGEVSGFCLAKEEE